MLSLLEGKKITWILFFCVIGIFFEMKDVHLHKAGKDPNKGTLLKCARSVLHRPEFLQFFFKNYLFNILKVYSRDFISLGVTYRSIFINNYNITKLQCLYKTLLFKKQSPQFNQEIFFCHFYSED